MLSNLKEKFLNVSLFANTDEKNKKAKDKINVNVGAEILQNFQTDWEKLHKINEDNAKEAQKVADTIETISEKIKTDKKNLGLITHILSTSNLTTNIANCLSIIRDLYTISENIENDLIKLEDIIEGTEYENMKKQHQYHLVQYKERKQEALDNFKHSLEENHSKKVCEYEASKKTLMEERQKVFQEAFKSDLELYKNSGTVPVNQHQIKQNGALLEEIQIDFDQNELDQFFSNS